MQFHYKLYNNSIYNRFVIRLLSNLFFWYCVIIAAALIVFSSVTMECSVVGTSMQPNLNKNASGVADTVFVNKYNYNYDYGEIVVVKVDNKSIIKRIIGMPGDCIDVVYSDGEYKLERNGVIVDEDYILITSTKPDGEQNGMNNTYDRFQILKLSRPELFENEKLIVPEKSLFVLGDNREVSKDSSYYGTFTYEKVEGVVENIKYGNQSEFDFYYNYILKGEFFTTIFNLIKK